MVPDSVYHVYRWSADVFWDQYLWVSPGCTWDDLERRRRLQDIVDYPIAIAFVFIIVRLAANRFIYVPCGQALGLKQTRQKKASPNDLLENAYRSSRKILHKQIQGLAKQLDWEARQVERWIRVRRQQDKPSQLSKFSESGWRLTYYVAAVIYGLYVLWDKSWLWDIKYCWYDYPHHTITGDIWWYYMLSLAFYWSLTMAHFFETKRKDFWQMLFHHLVTICLLSFSWTGNLTRIGTLVLLLHDVADIFLEAAKLANYAHCQKLCDLLFVAFAIIWVITRLGVFPCWILYSTLVEATYILEWFPAYIIFNSMLLMLLLLHFFWTYFIFKVAVKTFSGGSTRDTRSSSSESCNSDVPNNSNHVSPTKNRH